ncbi:MAG: DHH family phosphoesterase [Candidatus Hadarchaeota archaeon]
MSYEEFVQRLHETVPGFPAAIGMIDRMRKREGLRVLNFSHHDTDGITSAFILRRIFERYCGAKVVTEMPQHFKLWEEALVDALEKKGKFDLLVISDKGTFEVYDDLLKHIDNILIIDHHQLDGRPSKCTLFNPTVEVSEYAASASLLCHALATKLGVSDIYDDFAALLGCRGDFAFDPVEGTTNDFAKPFIEMAREKFPLAFDVKVGEPTMYELIDRERTALVNQMGEVFHSGCLAHLYNRAIGTDDIYGPSLVHDFLIELVQRGENPSGFSSVEKFLGDMPKGRIINKVFRQYKADWAVLEKRAENEVFLGEVRGVGVYMIFAKEAESMNSAPFPAILPFVASTRLEKMKRAGGHVHAMVIVFSPKEKGIHISMRGGGGLVNCGKLCFQLATRLQERYPNRKGIGGGGHARAAELLADKPTPMYAVMHELLFVMGEVAELAKALDSGKASQEEVEKAAKLGLDGIH